VSLFSVSPFVVPHLKKKIPSAAPSFSTLALNKHSTRCRPLDALLSKKKK